ncbi:N-acetylneuraminic acid synthase [Methanocalculus taiwanensis]|uniref:N-acetylneuraminic acid synthase n=1 Tax=Methanocalculus taiwanensis TaxID=106207 RepID=A0ABD4TGV5_9EURY|nr:N-acetylneuraminate synthase family protein [Methanocalculus taiwanensis]MCQ1538189.1 N-acetylneuraminic acid synthase [Methanocalculus taiwanensis]
MMPQFVAEVSSNHYRDLERCHQFIDTAAKIGCSAIKFQLFKIDELFVPDIVAARPDIQRRKNWELPVSFIPHLAERCRERGIQFSCTPFYLDAVAELLPYVDFYKIASYELLWNDLLTACAMTGKPVVLSTGMATLEEVRNAVTVLQKSGCLDLTLLHCASVYPTPAEKCNLAAIETLRSETGCTTGWSDHSVSPPVIYRAVHRWRSSMIEFHLDLDGKGEEYSGGHCWLPEEMKEVIETVRLGYTADGNGLKEPDQSEMREREWRADPTDGLRPLRSTRRLKE